jgi:hypothetical protein
MKVEAANSASKMTDGLTTGSDVMQALMHDAACPPCDQN